MPTNILKKELELTIEKLDQHFDLARFLGKNSIDDVIKEFSEDNKYLQYEAPVQEMESYHVATYNHLLRASIISWAVYKFLNNRGYRFKEKIDAPMVILAALYHDIGKVDIDQSTLNHNCPLNESQRHEIKKHTEKGAYLIDKILKGLPEVPKEYVRGAADLHHEDLNGDGYAGLMDPKRFHDALQLISIVDTFDAALFREGYQEPVPKKYMREYLRLVSMKSNKENQNEIKYLQDTLGNLKNAHEQPLFKNLNPSRYLNDVVWPLVALLDEYAREGAER